MKNELIYRYLQGLCTADETQRVHELLASDDEFKKEFKSVEAIFNTASTYNHPTLADADVAWNQFNLKINNQTKPKHQNRKWLWYSSAAVVTTLVVALSVIFFNTPHESDYIAINGMDKGIVELSDGSIIWMNTDAVLSVDQKFGEETRNVNLEGSAFFEIAPDQEKPFRVSFDGVQLTVVGTKFEINGAGTGKSTIRVSEGKVETEFNGKVYALGRGEAFTLDTRDEDPQPVLSDFTPEIPKWTGENLQFVEQRLDVIINTVEQFYGIRIEVDDKLTNMVFTVNLTGLNENTALQTLATVTGLVLEKKDDRYSLKP